MSKHTFIIIAIFVMWDANSVRPSVCPSVHYKIFCKPRSSNDWTRFLTKELLHILITSVVL